MIFPQSDLTTSGGNPSFKMYDVDPDTYEIMDARVFTSESFFWSCNPRLTRLL